MQASWSIELDWQELASGTVEEQACFASLRISAYGASLTTGHDRLLQSMREAPFLSTYHLAEWFAANWWRLRWEPARSSLEWQLSHVMTGIGNGYLWPDIRITSDGENITLQSRPGSGHEATAYHYIVDAVNVIPATDFVREVDIFIDKILCRLQDRKVIASNLEQLWQSVLEERQDPTLTRKRKLEAFLGEDPGEMDDGLLEYLLVYADVIGEEALDEIAANRNTDAATPDIGALLARVQQDGISTRLQDRIKLEGIDSKADSRKAAWAIGSSMARAVRAAAGYSFDQQLSNRMLTEIHGAPASLLDSTSPSNTPDLSMSVTDAKGESKILLRSPRETGRRFELARLIADHLAYSAEKGVQVATRSYTYRQKLQRSFAAELLAPFEAVEEMLAGDYSMESQQEVAHHFGVSDMTISTQLVNHDRIDRSELSL